MKRAIVIVLIAGLAAALGIAAMPANAEEKAPAPKLETQNQRFSYFLGVQVAQQLKGLQFDLNVPTFSRAIKDTLGKDGPALNQEQLQAIASEFGEYMQAQHRQAVEGNVSAGKEFREANQKKEDVTVTEEGLQIETLRQGDGPQPDADATVKVHYRGTLIDGTEFDSSYKRNQPAVFPLNRVIKGWGLGLQKMNVGGKYRLVVPPELGYGERGAGELIGPNATLVFEIELLEIME